MTRSEVSTGRQKDPHLQYEKIRDLLHEGRYETVISFLKDMQYAHEQDGNTLQADILAAVRHICLMCHQFRTSVELQESAIRETERREQSLVAEVESILGVIANWGKESAERIQRPVDHSTFGYAESGTEAQLSLWQRVQSLFRLGSVSVSQVPSTGPAGVAADPGIPPATPDQLTAGAVGAIESPGKPSAPSLVIYCLGPFRLFDNDQAITKWNGLKGQHLFRYLVANHDRPVTKDVLMEVFWPDMEPEYGRRNLHQAVYSLRQVLRQTSPDFQHILFENDCYAVNPDMGLWLDFREFERRVQAGQQLERAGRSAEAMVEFGVAEGLYQGDFMEDSLYEDWSMPFRDRLHSMYLEVADRLSEHYLATGEYSASAALCQRILTRDSCYENAHARLMRCYLAQGQRHLAIRQYQLCKEALDAELDLVPSAEIEQLRQSIFAST